MTIQLGYEIGTGEAVSIPLDHSAFTGRTQESGKSTTCEALAIRSGRPNLAFLTKRGEKSFRKARMIPPYYRDKIDPDSIAALLSSAVGEKMQGKLGEIIWLCEGHRGGRGKNTYSWPAAHSLADVLKNCETALTNATDKESQRLYTVLQHYLRKIVKQVAVLPKSAKIDLERGLNVMDLREFEPGTQSLIIHDSVMWVAERGRGITTIIPEAWKFVGQGKKSPVLAACEELIRQGGTLGNYLWLDSQDLVLHTNILRSVGVYILGVQRERNEVNRVLDYIPDAFPKLKRSDIQKLDVGQFWVCYKRKTTLTYVMPEWGDPIYSKGVALGMSPPPEAPKEKLEVRSQKSDEVAQTSDSEVCGSENPQTSADTAQVCATVEDDEMEWKAKHEEAERERKRLTIEIGELAEKVESQSILIRSLREKPHPVVSGAAKVNGIPVKVDADGAFQIPGAASPDSCLLPRCSGPRPDSFDTLYFQFKSRLLRDPQAIIALRALTPEIEVMITRPTITMEGKTLPGRLAALLAAKWFDAPRIQAEIYKELVRTGPDVNRGNLYQQLKKLKEIGFLSEEGDGNYQAVPEMKVRIKENGD